ncbi:MAG: hypothetical protein ACR2KH_08000, partial [Sphingomicrobium sp.]
MLHQELPSIDVTRLDRASRWLVPALTAAAALTGALLAWLLGYPMVAAAFVVAGLIGAAVLKLVDKRSEAPVPAASTLSLSPDYSVIGSTLALSLEPAALTNGDGALLIANSAYRERFGGACPPLDLGTDDDSSQSLQLVRTMAWRDGGGC